MEKIKLVLLASISILITTLMSCASEEKPFKAESSITKVVLPQPFRYHKPIEVKPGLTFDVLSWGRGAEHVGQYLILRSDSSDVKYSTISEELEGDIIDAWNMDLDSDGNPEIFIQAKGQDKDSYFKLYVYEFSESGSSQELKFPELTSATKKKYHGKDSVYVKEGNLFREFPLYEETDTAGLKPIERKVLEYSLRGNRFDIHEIKKEGEE
ncbi:MAG: hypothetical protein H7Y13_05480 [Sphingobacteriaceae bacterium]|nr:hypothetical protein [Sphingobacteriaceae bacterium]